VFSTVLLFREALYGALVIALACSVIGLLRRAAPHRVRRRGSRADLVGGIALALWLAGAGIALGPLGHPTSCRCC
jgi:hypothetical protein